MIKFVQLNLNHCQAAQDLLSQTIRENRVDVAIICDQYKNLDDNVWVTDKTGKVAIWACGNRAIEDVAENQEDGFVRAKIGGIYIYSCYGPPSASLEEFGLMLDKLVRDAAEHKPNIIAGDFNAWAVEWGSRRTNRRGKALLEAFSNCDLVLANEGDTLTFRAQGTGSVIDLTFVSSSLMKRMDGWTVSEHYTHSDHQAIYFRICKKKSGLYTRSINDTRTDGWASRQLDEECFLEAFQTPALSGTAEDMAAQIATALRIACDISMPRRRLAPSRPPN